MIIDPEAMDRLKEIGDENDPWSFVREIVATYNDTCPGFVEQLVAALEGRDLYAIGRRTHQLKGLCLNIGALPLIDLCLRLEAATTLEAIDALGDVSAQLRAAVATTERALAELIPPRTS